MSNPHIYNLLNDLVRVSATMQERAGSDLARLAEARRIGYDARAILRLLLAEHPAPVRPGRILSLERSQTFPSA